MATSALESRRSPASRRTQGSASTAACAASPRLENLASSRKHCSYFSARRGAAAGPVAFLTVLLQQRRDVPVERHVGRGRDGTSRQNREQDKQEAEEHAAIVPDSATRGLGPHVDTTSAGSRQS